MRSKKEEIMFWLDHECEIIKKRSDKDIIYNVCYKGTNQIVRLTDASFVLGINHDLFTDYYVDWWNQKMSIDI